MNKIIGGTALAVLSFCLTSCGGSGSADKMITPERVGKVTFAQDVPDMGRGYTTVRDTLYFDSDEGWPYFRIKDKDGELAANVFPGQSIEVYAPDFKTEAGIHPGMPLEEAIRIVGDENLNIWLGWPNNYFTVDDRSSGLAWNISGDQLAGGQARFDQLSMEGTPVKFEDFGAEARIGWITVINYSEEDESH